jgi:hypothetical protein
MMMNDVAKRALRTFAQASLAVLVLLLSPWLLNLATTVQQGGDIQVDFNWLGNVALAAIGGGLAALIAFLMNFIEDKSGTDILPK